MSERLLGTHLENWELALKKEQLKISIIQQFSLRNVIKYVVPTN